MQTTTLPEGWGLKGSHPDDYEAGITPDAIDGKAAAYLRARVASSGFGTIMQQFKADAYRGQRLRLGPQHNNVARRALFGKFKP